MNKEELVRIATRLDTAGYPELSQAINSMAKATPGNWHHYECRKAGEWGGGIISRHNGDVLNVSNYSSPGFDDTQFIIAAHETLPQFAATILHLQEKLREAEQRLKDAKSELDEIARRNRRK